MVKKNIFVALIAMLMVFSVPGYNRLSVSAPEEVAEVGDIEQSQEFPLEGDQDPAKRNDQFPAIQIVSNASAAPISAFALSIPKVQKRKAVIKSEPRIDSGNTAIVPETAKPITKTPSFLVSEWIDVPNSLIEHFRSLPVPAPLVKINNLKTPVASAARPIVVKPIITKPLVENASSLVSSAVFGRPLLPLIPLVRTFSLIEITSSHVSSLISTRPLLDFVPEHVIAKPSIKSFSLVETTFSQVSSSISTRPLLPLIPEPAITKPTIKSFSLVETASSQVLSSVFERPLQLLFKTSVAAAPVAKVETKPASSSIDPALTAVNVSQTRAEAPAVINGQTAFSQEMLRPLVTVPQPSEMLLSDAPIGSSGGPSIESSLTTENPVTATVSNRAAETRPVLITAQSIFSMDMLKPMSSRPTFPPNPFSSVDAPAIEGNFCDPNYVGPPIRFSQTIELKLDDLLNQVSSRFGVNFIVGPGIGQLPLNVKAGNIPWNVLLRSQLYVSGVRSQCIDSSTIELVLNDKVVGLEKGRNEAEKLETRYIKLKYLQPSSSENKNIAGQSSGSGGGQNGSGQGCQQSQGSQGGGQGGGSQSSIPQRCKFERLMTEVRQILGINDQAGAAIKTEDSSGGQSSVSTKGEAIKRAYVGQVPGRNMLLVNATESQLKDIQELIRHADVPPFQVVIKGLVYTANENKLKDIGVTASAILGTGNLNTLGGVTSQPGPAPASSPGTGTTATTTTGDLLPGGVRTLGPGFSQPSGNGNGIFGFSTIIGTAQFSMQVNALQQNGTITLKSRPFATVLDGDTTDLTVGRQVPVIIQAVNNLGGAVGTLQILQAANLLSVTPHVIDDENGNPTAVNLELQLESNDVDPSIISQGVPSVSVKSIQSNFILNQEQTAILGGFTVDSDSKTVTKTPGLGDVPILGELFKRRVRTTQISRLYFAISVTVIPYGGNIEPVKVPGATTDPPTLTPEMKKRADAAEPKQVVAPANDPH